MSWFGGERAAEGAARQRVVARRLPAELGRAERAPGDAVARIVEAGEGSPEAGDVRQQIGVGHEHVSHGDLARDRGAQRELALDLRRGEPLHAALEDEPADHPLVVLRPHHHDVGDRRIADPHLAAVEDVAAIHLAGAALHAARVRAMIGLGQAEAADHLAGRELGQVFLPLLLGAEGVDRMHHQGRLHGQGRAVAAIDAFDLAGDDAIGDVAGAGAAIALDRRAEKAELAHFRQDLAIDSLLAERLLDARHQLLLREGAGAVADEALLLAEQVIEQQRILPVEDRALGGLAALAGGGFGHESLLGNGRAILAAWRPSARPSSSSSASARPSR